MVIGVSGFDIVQDLNREGRNSFTPRSQDNREGKQGKPCLQIETGDKVTFVARPTFSGTKLRITLRVLISSCRRHSPT